VSVAAGVCVNVWTCCRGAGKLQASINATASRDEQRVLNLEVLVGSSLAKLYPMTGFFTAAGVFVPNPAVYTLEDNDILEGRLVAECPPGQGTNVSIVVRHRGADASSDPVYIDFLPPSNVRFVGSVDPYKWTRGTIDDVRVASCRLVSLVFSYRFMMSCVPTARCRWLRWRVTTSARRRSCTSKTSR
jgi:hypothetical protein